MEEAVGVYYAVGEEIPLKAMRDTMESYSRILIEILVDVVVFKFSESRIDFFMGRI